MSQTYQHTGQMVITRNNHLGESTLDKKMKLPETLKHLLPVIDQDWQIGMLKGEYNTYSQQRLRNRLESKLQNRLDGLEWALKFMKNYERKHKND